MPITAGNGRAPRAGASQAMISTILRHASAALAYCQAFFTEHALRATVVAPTPRSMSYPCFNPRSRAGVERRCDRPSGIGEEDGDAGERLVLLGIEDMEDRTDQQHGN